MKVFVVAIAGATLFATGISAQMAEKDPLAGLWSASERYGPDIRGPLMIRPVGDGFVADLVGFSVPVQEQGATLSFELPDGKGSFRGKRSGTTIEGQWIQALTKSS